MKYISILLVFLFFGCQKEDIPEPKTEQASERGESRTCQPVPLFGEFEYEDCLTFFYHPSGFDEYGCFFNQAKIHVVSAGSNEIIFRSTVFKLSSQVVIHWKNCVHSLEGTVVNTIGESVLKVSSTIPFQCIWGLDDEFNFFFSTSGVHF